MRSEYHNSNRSATEWIEPCSVELNSATKLGRAELIVEVATKLAQVRVDTLPFLQIADVSGLEATRDRIIHKHSRNSISTMFILSLIVHSTNFNWGFLKNNFSVSISVIEN